MHWSASQIALVAVLLCACLTCIWMVFFFGRRLQSTAFLRNSLVEGIKQQELRALLRELHDEAVAGPLDPAKPPPADFGPPAQLWTEGIYRSYQDRWSGPASWEGKPETPEQRQARERTLAECAEWEKEERARYELRRQDVERKAQKQAEARVPRSMDISLLGGGWAFLLEFSTVIVIIFAVLILAILGTLTGQEISTILAAIAGYVLGKASAGGRQPGTKEQPSHPDLG
jgi:hypothetical protein